MPERERVLTRLIRQCRLAHQGPKPFLLIDTESHWLMDQIVLEGQLVPLRTGREYRCGDKMLRYYSHLEQTSDPLRDSVNLHYDPARLQDAGRDTPEGPALSSVYVIHLTATDPRQPRIPEETAALLRQYQHRYVHCRDPFHPLRGCCVLLYGDPQLLPKDLLPDTQILQEEYPQVWEITEILLTEASQAGHPFASREDAARIAPEFSGFSLAQVHQQLYTLLYADEVEGRPLLFHPKQRKALLLEAKRQMLLQSGDLLEFWGIAESQEAQTGGMAQYKQWNLNQKSRMLSAPRYTLLAGVPSPKGTLLCGISGCGKSQAVKDLWRSWGIPMLRMDMGRLMNSLVGQSERNLRLALRQAEAMAPCILWIDEIERAWSGAGTHNGDSGTSQRMIGTLLTWLQEKEQPCYVFATANDVTHLDEGMLFRHGRFDNRFAVYMPTRAECIEIFRAQMYQREKLRREAAEVHGLSAEVSPIFEESCYSDKTLGGILDSLTRNAQDPHILLEPEQVKFLTGANIAHVVIEALSVLAQKELHLSAGDLPDKALSISDAAWRKAVIAVLAQPTTLSFGYGSANLDAIAGCYVRLLRKHYVSAAPEEALLFSPRYYRVTEADDGRRQVHYDGTPQLQNEYDRALYQALLPRILEIGSRLESGAINRIAK